MRLQLAGFLWGDCSLSNTLFQRDAGALSTYVIDMATGEHDLQLSEGQRRYALQIEDHYNGLWAELTEPADFVPGTRFRIKQWLQRLQSQGFDVEEMDIVGTSRKPAPPTSRSIRHSPQTPTTCCSMLLTRSSPSTTTTTSDSGRRPSKVIEV